MVPPLAVDIDGTLSRPDRTIDPRIFDALSAWGAQVVIATGKAFPYPVALAEFVGIEKNVIAENGGVSLAADTLEFLGDRTAADAVISEYRDAGYELGYGSVDLANYWRETEVAVSRDSPLGPLEEIAERHGLEVVDTEYAYHVKSPDVDKGRALESVANALDFEASQFVAIGDSENDVELFETAGTAFAVGNAVDGAKRSADHVMEGTYADGFLEALNAFY
ncbi:MAG: phosphoglycolate phosphatase [Halodesulfurarchaeum sp.]